MDEIVAKDDLWRKVQFDVNQASKEQNAFNKEAGLCAKNKDEAGKAKAMENSKACKAKIAELKASEAKVVSKCAAGWLMSALCRAGQGRARSFAQVHGEHPPPFCPSEYYRTC